MGGKPRSGRNSAFSQGSGAGRTTPVVQKPTYDEPEEDADQYEDADEEEHEEKEENESSTPQTTVPNVTTAPAVSTTTTTKPTVTPVSTKKSEEEEETIRAKERDDDTAESITEHEPDKLTFFKNRIGSSCKSCGETIKSLHDSYRNHDIETTGLCSTAHDAIDSWDKSEVSSITKKTLGLSEDSDDDSIKADDPSTWTPEMKKAHKAHYEEFAPHFKDLDTERNIGYGFAPKDIDNWTKSKDRWNLGTFNGLPAGAEELREVNTEKEVKHALNRVGKPCSFCGEDISSVKDLDDHHIDGRGWCGTARHALKFASDD